MKASHPIPRDRGRVKAFKKALHDLALGRRLKLYGLVRRGEPTYRIIVFVLEMLKALLAWGYAGWTVVFEAWYAWPWFLAAVRGLGYHFLTRARWDTKIRDEGIELTMAEFFGPHLRTYKRLGRTTTLYRPKIVEVVGVGPVKAVCVRYWCAREQRYQNAVLITSRLTWTGPQIIAAYLDRGRIEQAIQETKQCFGLENYHVRSWQSIQHYLALSMLAYNVSQVLRQAEHPPTPVPSLVAQFRVAHLADHIWKGQQRVMRAIYRSLQELYDATEFPDWEAVQTLFQCGFAPNYQT